MTVWTVSVPDDHRDPKILRFRYAVADVPAIGKELERRGYQVKLILYDQATAWAINTELPAS